MSSRENDEYTCISIHALREEGDLYYEPQKSLYPDFYPRPPRGGRQSSFGIR